MPEYITLDDLPRLGFGGGAGVAPARPSGRLPTVDDVRAQAQAKGVDPDLAVAIFSQESGGNFKSPNSPKGAVGGMQVMPGTFKQMLPEGNINDPWDNLEAGLRYLEHGQKKLGTNDPRILAAGYHQGYNRPELARGEIAPTSDGLIETPAYAGAVLARMGVTGAQPGQAPRPAVPARGRSAAGGPPSSRILSDLAQNGLSIAAPTQAVDAPPSGERPGILSQIGSDIVRGVDQAQGIAYGLTALGADALGASGAQRWAMEGVRRNEAEAAARPPVIGSHKNIRTDNLGDFTEDLFRYTVEAMGENLAVMAPTIVSGGVGGIITKKVVEKGVEGAVAKYVAGGMAREAAEKAVMTTVNRQIALGAVAGGYLPSWGMEAGSIYNDIVKETGKGEPGIAAAYGAVAGLFDAIPGAIGVTRAVKVQVTKQLAEGILSRYGKAAVGQFASEAPTELVQTIIEKAAVNKADPKYDIWSDQNVTEMIDSFLKGGLAGGGFGVTTQAVSDYRGRGRQEGASPAARAAAGGINAPIAAADVLGVPAVDQAADALVTPVQATALDRVNAIDQQLRSLPPESPDGASLQAERDQLTRSWPKMATGANTTFQTESGVDLEGKYAVVEADDLVSSHDTNLRPNPAFPKELQPRARERAASEIQVSNIVQKLNPERLGLSPDVANGAPIIGADGLVESGNARTIALKRVYEAGGAKAKEYADWLAANAARFGLAPDQISGMRAPVLVRVRDTPVNRAEFARQANASTVARMSTLEQARADGARVGPLDDFVVSEDGAIAPGPNRVFIQRFLGGLPPTEQADLLSADGNLSQTGLARIRNAVLARAYGDSPVLDRMVESLDNNMRNITSALVRVAPQVARARDDIAAGALQDRDIVPDILSALEELSRLRDQGRSVADYLAQSNMFGNTLSPEAAELLQFLNDNVRSPRKIAAFVENYLVALAAAGSTTQGSLLGDQDAPPKQAIIAAAKERTNGADQNAVPGGASPAAADGTTRADGAGSQGKGGAAQDTGAGQEGGKQPGGAQAAGPGAPAGVAKGKDWAYFGPESGTLGIPRAEMPQVRIARRPAMLQYMEDNGVNYERVDVEADTLKPTQAEYQRSKVERSKELAEDRTDASAVLVSSDGFVADGHHRWLAKAEEHQPVNTIRFDVPIRRLLELLHAFSKAPVEEETAPLLSRRVRDTQTVDMFGGAAPEPAKAPAKPAAAPATPAPKSAARWDQGLDTAPRKDNPIPRSTVPLSKEGAAVEERFRNLVWNNLDAAIAEYRKRFDNVLNTDNARELSADYDASKDTRATLSAAVHEPASFLVKEAYKRMLAEPLPKGKFDMVMFTAGGTGSGKSTGLMQIPRLKRMSDAAHIIYDTNLNGTASAKKKIDQARAADKQVVIIHVYRDPVEAMLNGALPRAMRHGRAVPIAAHMETHIESAKTIVELEKAYRGDLGVDFGAVDNSRGRGAAAEVPIDFAAGKEHNQLYENLARTVESEYKAGRISEAVYRGTLGGSDTGRKGEGPQGVYEGSPGGIRGRTERERREGSDQLTPATAGVVASGGADAPVSGDRREGAEGKVAGAAQGADGKRGAGGVRSGEGGRDRRGDQPGDAAAPGATGQPVGARTGQAPDGGAADVRGAGAEGPSGVPEGRRVIPQKSGRNYTFTDDDLSYEGSWYKKAVQNVEAIELIKRLESEGRDATREEQSKLARYVGFGAGEIRNALFPSRSWTIEPRWMELRERLEAVLSDEEMETLKRSTQYAHYTDKAIVRSIWRAFARMGFKGGSILEPGAGIGVFPGLLSPEVAGASTYTGIEYDKMTGAILARLMPDERILVESYVDSKLPRDFFDVVVGNPPFARVPILADPEYRKLALALHDYFFAKSIDRTKPGGLLVFVSSHYTMDKGGEKMRAYMAKRADLVGAIRLPQTAFKQNAGTEVVTDVLFFRKRVEGEPAGGHAWAKLKTVKTKEGDALVNEYFVANPSMVLGTHSLQGSQYKENEYTVLPKQGTPIEEQFAAAVERLPENIFKPVAGSPAQQAQVRDLDMNPKAQKEGNYYVSDDGRLMVREGGVGVAVPTKRGNSGPGVTAKHAEVIRDFVRLRDALKQAHFDQLNDGDWEASLRALQKEYRAFVKKHGKVNQFKVYERQDKKGEAYSWRRYPLLDIIDDDPDYTRVMALEKVNDDTGAISESAFLSDRVLNKPRRPEVRSVSDAMLTVLNERGNVDLPQIAALMRITVPEVIESLGSSIYEDPTAGWQVSDEYLSSNVRQKLLAAQEAAKHDRRFERNVEALLAVQPTPISAQDITASLGMNWIPTEYYEEFLKETAGVSAAVAYNPRVNHWLVQPKAGWSNARATTDWGTMLVPAHEILDHALTKRPIRVTKIEGSGKDAKRVTDADATEAANQKLAAMKVEFMSWIWRDEDRKAALSKLYNDKFNTNVPREFDGRHLTLPGTSSRWKIHDHVKRGAWRIVQRGNTYLAHAVGAGKTFESIIATQEMKRLGMISKPIFIVPNHMLQQFAREFQDLYPAAKLMVADEKQFHTERRRRFVSRVALSDLDGVVITHSAFKLLDMNPAFKQRMIEEQLEYFRAVLEEAGGGETSGKKSRDPKIRQIENQIERLEQKLKDAMSSAGKDRNVLFDELGVDFAVVDEAHEYRKLAFATAMQIKGVDPVGSDKAFDLWMKTRWLEEKHPGRSLVMMSGTPITNTLAELYTVQRFMDPGALEERGLTEFDAWAATFGEEVTDLEPNAVGGYENVSRFSNFVNVGELVQMFREFADVLTSSQLGEILTNGRPKVKGGTRKLVLIDQIPELTHYLKTELNDRLAASRKWKPSFDEPYNPDPVINIITDGRLSAIDMRFVNPLLPSNPGSKLNRMIDQVIASYKEGAEVEYLDKDGKPDGGKGSTQMVFSDLGFGEGVALNRGFDARAWMLQRLTEAGIPKAHIAFMSDYKKSEEKLKLFRAMNTGKMRILIGSSKNMGTGVNAQQRLAALHHLDVPWYPADLEQREGRIVRFGNKNKTVDLFAYATRGGYDSTMWQMVSRKQRFIEQALSGDSSVRRLEDISESSNYAMAAAMTAGDQRAIQLAGLNAEIGKLDRLRRAHETQQAKMQRDYDWTGRQLAAAQARLPEELAGAARVVDLSGDKFTAKVGSTAYSERKLWGEALIARYKSLAAKATDGDEKIGEISGFDITFHGLVTRDNNQAVVDYAADVMLDGAGGGALLMNRPDADPVGLAMRSVNVLEQRRTEPVRTRDEINGLESRRESLASRMGAPFEFEQMLREKVREADRLEAELAKGTPLEESTAEPTLYGDIDIGEEMDPAEAEQPPYLSLEPGEGGMSATALESIVLPRVDGLKNLAPGGVHVVERADQLPAKLRNYLLSQSVMDETEGLYDPDTKAVWLISRNIDTPARGEFVLFHELFGHYGLRGMFGSELNNVLGSLWARNANIRREASKLNASFGYTHYLAIEEAVANLAGEGKTFTGLSRLMAAIQAGLRKLGLDRVADMLEGITDAEVLKVLADAKRFVADGKKPHLHQKGMGPMAPAMSRQPVPAAPAQGASPPAKPTADDVLAKKVPKFAPLETVARLAVKATFLDRVTSGGYDRLLALLNRMTPERVKGGMVSDYGIPEAVVDRRAEMQGRLRGQYRQVEGVLASLGNLTRAESRVAYEWANADNPQSAEWFRQQLPAESIEVLAEVERTIDKLSAEAVRLGQLSPEARDRNRFAYLRRSYVKHTAELTEQERVGRSKAMAVLGEQYKGRGMVQPAPMRQVQNVAPEWWKRKLQAGKADKSLKGEKLIRFERRSALDPNLTTNPLPGMGPSKAARKLLEVHYWPASEPVPAKYGAWDEVGTWEVTDVKGDNLVLWRDFTKQEREQLGEIDEIKYAVAKTLHGMIHDIEMGRYLEYLAQRHARADDAGIADRVVEASELLRHAFRADEWVQVPDSTIPGTGGVKRYGKLSGMYLPAPIWNDVRQVVNFRYQPFGEMYSKILRAWKISKTALSPAVHMNNVMSNFVMADWHDVRASHVAKALRILVNQKDPTNKEVINRFQDSGGAIGTYALTELQREQLEPLLEELRKEVGIANQVAQMVGMSAALHLAVSGKFREALAAAAESKPARGAVKVGGAMTALYEAEDVVFRLAAFLKAKEEGSTDQVAGKFARRSFLDYSINAPWVQAMRNTAFPFISFTYRALPMLLETAAKKPWKILKLGLFFGGLNALAYAATGGDEDRERKLLPEEKAGKLFGVVVPKLIRLPWNDANGSPVFLDVRRWVPVGDVFDLGQTHSAIPTLPFAVPGGPLAVLAELLFNKSQFTGKEITKGTDTALEKMKAVADHMYKALLPNIGFIPGTYAFQGMKDAATGKTDAFGREQSLAQAAGSAVGVKVGSYPEDVLRRNMIAKRDSQLREIGERQAALRREFVRKGINVEEFDRKMADQLAKRQKVQKEFGDRMQ